jgi:hypothetical protein
LLYDQSDDVDDAESDDEVNESVRNELRMPRRE